MYSDFYKEGGGFMSIYKKLYAYLVGEVDKALTLMDGNDFLQYQNIEGILQNALLTAEEMYIESEEE